MVLLAGYVDGIGSMALALGRIDGIGSMALALGGIGEVAVDTAPDSSRMVDAIGMEVVRVGESETFGANVNVTTYRSHAYGRSPL